MIAAPRGPISHRNDACSPASVHHAQTLSDIGRVKSLAGAVIKDLLDSWSALRHNAPELDFVDVRAAAPPCLP